MFIHSLESTPQSAVRERKEKKRREAAVGGWVVCWPVTEGWPLSLLPPAGRGDLQDLVDVVGEDGGEVRTCVPGHVGAERRLAGVLRVLHVPDFRHAAARPGSPGAPGILQDKIIHAELHQVPLDCFSRHAAVHGVDQLGPFPQPGVLIVGVVDDGTSSGELHAGHGGHRTSKHRTWWRLLLDPAQQLLLWRVAELSDDAPLALKVGHALDRHQRQHGGGGRLVSELLADPAKQLSGAEQRRHDAHVWREEELQTHDEDSEDGEGQQLQTVKHQLSFSSSHLGYSVLSRHAQ